MLNSELTVKEIIYLFVRLGALGFGGPVALIAMMEEEVCRKRNWVSKERFTEIYAVCKILPGPVAVQMAIFLGSVRGATLGGFLAGFFFILPSFLMVLALSYTYVNTQLTQKFGSAFITMQAAALGVVLLSTFQLAKPYLKKQSGILIGLISLVLLYLWPKYEPFVIFFFGLSGAYIYSRSVSSSSGSRLVSFAPGFLAGLVAKFPTELFSDTIYLRLFWVCFKAGEFVFGSGLAIIPLLEAEVVQHYHWLTHAEFMDGLAIGQVTPGPVTITVTFIGFKTAGILGALVATGGIYLPPFINVLYILPRIWKKISGTPGARGFTSWAFPAVIGGILGATLNLARVTLISPLPLGIFLAVLLIGLYRNVPAWILVPGAGIFGVISQLFTTRS